MLSKTVTNLSRSTTEMINTGVDRVRGLTWNEVRDLVRFARRRLTEEKLPQVAGSLTFTTTLAIVPLLTIVLAIFTTFPMFGKLRTALDNYFVQMLMPKAIANTITSNLTQFASKATGLSAVGGIALVFTTVALIGTIERAFNQIWKVRRPRPVVQRVLVYWALVTLGPLAFGLSLTLTSQLFSATNGVMSLVPFLGAVFYTVVSVALTTGAYVLLYMTVPNRDVDWRDAMWGGLVAAIAFEVAKRVFAIFIRQFPTYAIIYGALAALPLFLVWMYLSWMITLVGALLTAALPIVKYERWWYEPVPGGAFVDAMAVLKVLHGGARLTGTAMVSSAQIRTCTRIGYDEMTELLERMVAAGWVGRVHVEEQVSLRWRMGKRGGARAGTDCWVLLVDPRLVRLADVYRLFVFGGVKSEAGAPADGAQSPLALDTAALARQVEASVERGLDETLAGHFDRVTS
ncbi:YihY family inner membrane protein [Massilia orientalis]|uniref:YihY family inner membrane protein n=1 Tax=Massilia orientalis TaxID=3050128 RepID=A0ACC7M871_9BURK|nr:YihY family inner membrane protein [Massilia sp. YIM B02787]